MRPLTGALKHDMARHTAYPEESHPNRGHAGAISTCNPAAK